MADLVDDFGNLGVGRDGSGLGRVPSSRRRRDAHRGSGGGGGSQLASAAAGCVSARHGHYYFVGCSEPRCCDVDGDDEQKSRVDGLVESVRVTLKFFGGPGAGGQCCTLIGPEICTTTTEFLSVLGPCGGRVPILKKKLLVTFF